MCGDPHGMHPPFAGSRRPESERVQAKGAASLDQSADGSAPCKGFFQGVLWFRQFCGCWAGEWPLPATKEDLALYPILENGMEAGACDPYNKIAYVPSNAR